MDRILTPEESIVEILAADCRVHEHRGCSGCKTLATIDDLKDAKECWGGTAKLIANYYETIIIPQKVKEAVNELREICEFPTGHTLVHIPPSGFDHNPNCKTCRLERFLKSRGIE
jgi:hypothetical protein